MTNYDKFKEEYEKKVYESFTAEYKRVIGKRMTRTIFTEPSILFEKILSIITKGTDKAGNNHFIKGEQMKTNELTIFIETFQIDKEIEYRFKRPHIKNGNEFQIFNFKLKKTRNNFTRLTYSHAVKLPTTITGFNGKLGSIKFKRDVKKEANRMFEKLEKIFPPNSKK